MDDENVVVSATSPAPPSDLKRKLDDVESVVLPRSELAESNGNSQVGTDADVDASDTSEAPEAKRSRTDENLEVLRIEETEDLNLVETGEKAATEKPESEDDKVVAKEDLEVPKEEEGEEKEKPTIGNHEIAEEESKKAVEEENPEFGGSHDMKATEEESEKPGEKDDYTSEVSDTQTTSRHMDVPNNKVGVLIGKSGETIKYLQQNSGAKIQITRDAEADPHSSTRPVELIGTLDSIKKAEKLIKDVIAEADAGGSPALVAMGITPAHGATFAEQIEIEVPHEKVGLIIGKGGETIKWLQTQSEARIQLIPQHAPEGHQSKERTVRVSGDKKQIEKARELIEEVMTQPVRPSPYAGRMHRPTIPPHWASRGSHHTQPTPYEYQQRGGYPSHHPQYPPPSYGGYPPQHSAPRSGYASGWPQRPPPSSTMHRPHSGGYDYYSGPAGVHMPDGSHAHAHSPSPAMGPPHRNYNYGHTAPYSQPAQPQVGYGHGYDEMKYENQAAMQHHPYGGPQSYPPQQQYAKPASAYGMPMASLQAPHHPQSYGPQRPGEIPYQGPPAAQAYNPNVPPQLPYTSTGPVQQSFHPPYGSQPAADGYSQAPATAGAGGPVYQQQPGQPIYNQAVGQYPAQGGTTGGYGQYPTTTQQGYTDQAAVTNSAAYGYQGNMDPIYSTGAASMYGMPPSGQQGYAQPQPAQTGYDQSVPQSGVYSSGPVTYGKTVSPQTQPQPQPQPQPQAQPQAQQAQPHISYPQY